MKHWKGSWFLILVVCVAVAGLGAGCGKKPATETDVTTPSTSGQDDDGNGNGDGSALDRPGADEGTGGLKLGDVFFDYDKYDLRSDARQLLQDNARYLKENSGFSVLLEGHCDERGTNEYNLALGERRADAVRSYLIDLGVDGSRLSTISYGEEKPFALGHTENAWSQNRRVHFNVGGR